MEEFDAPTFVGDYVFGMPDLLPWLLVVVLTLSLGAVVRQWRVQTRAARTREEHVTATHLAQVDEIVRQHLALRSASAAEHDQRILAVRAEVDRAREETEALRKKLVHPSDGDRVSQALIREVCGRVGLSAVLVTNLVFIPVDRRGGPPFFAQVDHVLLSRAGIVVVENKHWAGMVFDGVRPSERLTALGALIDETRLDRRFAIQVRPSSSEGWIVREHLADRSPVVQVRRQAARLAELLATDADFSGWIDTAVLYSHSTAHVFAPAARLRPGRGETRVLAGEPDLAVFLSSVAKHPGVELPIERLRELQDYFERMGASVEHVGPVIAPPVPKSE